MTTTIVHENPLDRAVDAGNIASARTAYHVARQHRDDLRLEAHEAGLAVSRGQEALEAAQAALERLETASHEIAAHRAKTVRGGGDALAALPAALRAKREELRDAKDLADDLEAAQRRLVLDEERAAVRAEVAQRTLGVAARVLFAHEVAEDAEAYERIERRADPIRRRLAAVHGTMVSHHVPNRSDSLPYALMDRVARLARRFPVPNTLIGERRFETSDEQAVGQRLRDLMAGVEVQ